MKLEICDVSKQYKDKCAVDHASLTLTPGVWGLLGANGAGKTTLMRMIAGIMKPTGGEIRYDGIEIGTMGEEYREEIIALLDKIKDAGALAYLHTFIKLFAEKWG